MAKNDKFSLIAEGVLEAVGGKQNVINVSHCMTRLRFNLKDESIAGEEEIKKVAGVLGVMKSGGQVQIIIGQTVDQVYAALCEIGDFEMADQIDENLDTGNKKLTLARIGNNILDALSGCLTPTIPLIVAASMFKMLVAVLGPSMLNVIDESMDIYTLFTFVGDAGFYFMPIYLGYTAAKKFKATPVIGMFLGAALLHPTFVGLAGTEGATFSVYGIPVILSNYAASIIPAIVAVWILSYVERFFKKIIPSAVRIVFVPFFSMLVMLPITFVIIGPAGSFLGNYVSNALFSFSSFGGIFFILAVGLVAVLWEFLVISGMHLVLFYALLQGFAVQGFDSLVLPGAVAASLAVSGMALGASLRMKKKDERNLGFSYFITAFVGGVTEPALYGLGFRYKRPFIGMVIGALVGGLYYGITATYVYTIVASANFLALTGFVGNSGTNIVNGIIGGVLAFVSAVIATYFLGFKKDDSVLEADLAE